MQEQAARTRHAADSQRRYWPADGHGRSDADRRGPQSAVQNSLEAVEATGGDDIEVLRYSVLSAEYRRQQHEHRTSQSDELTRPAPCLRPHFRQSAIRTPHSAFLLASPTPAPAFRPKSAPTSSIRSSLAAKPAAALAWASPKPGASSISTAADRRRERTGPRSTFRINCRHD